MACAALVSEIAEFGAQTSSDDRHAQGARILAGPPRAQMLHLLTSTVAIRVRYSYQCPVGSGDIALLGAQVEAGGLSTGWLQVWHHMLSDTLLRQTSRASVYGS